jgi:hypothetical protein
MLRIACLSVAFLIPLIVNAGSSPAEEISINLKKWTLLEINDYSFILAWTMGGAPITSVEIVVKDGAIASARYLASELRDVSVDSWGQKTIEDLFSIASQYVSEAPARHTRLKFDGQYGFPAEIGSFTEEMTDSNVYYKVNDFRVLE